MKVNSRHIARMFGALIASTALLTTRQSTATDFSVQPGDNSLSTANASAHAGDRIFLSPGNYGTESISPTNAGSSLTSRITYIGSRLNTDASIDSYVVASASLTSYVTVRGIRLSGTASLNSAQYDSMAYCHMGPLSFDLADHSIVTRCRIDGDNTQNVVNLGTPYTFQAASFDTLRMCRVTGGTIAANSFLFEIRGGYKCVFDSSAMTATLGSSTDARGRWIYETTDCTWRDCKLTIEFSAATNTSQAVNFLRNGSARNLFVRDSMFVGLNSPLSYTNHRGLYLTGSGDNTYNGQCVYNQWASCHYVSTSDILLQDASTGLSITKCVLRTRGHFVISGSDDSLMFDHNTLMAESMPALQLEGTSYAHSRFKSNIIAGKSPSCSGGFNQLVHYSGSTFPDTMDYNLYVPYGGDTTAIVQVNSSSTCSDVGSGSTWCSSGSRDCHSLSSDPFIVDTSLAAFDPSLKSHSWAVGSRWPDGYVGAASGPPWPIEDLSVGWGRTTTTLTWTEPERNNNVAASYDVRYAFTSVNEGNFYNAYQVCWDDAGDPGDTKCIEVGSLDPCQTYYWAAITTDSKGASTLSNVPSGTTRCTNGEVSCGLRPIAESPARLDPDRPQVTITLGARWLVAFELPSVCAGLPFELLTYDVAGRRVGSIGRGVVGRDKSVNAPAGGLVRGGVSFVRIRCGSFTSSKLIVK